MDCGETPILFRRGSGGNNRMWDKPAVRIGAVGLGCGLPHGAIAAPHAQALDPLEFLDRFVFVEKHLFFRSATPVAQSEPAPVEDEAAKQILFDADLIAA